MVPEAHIRSPARAPWLVVLSIVVGVALSPVHAYTLSVDVAPKARLHATIVPERLATEK